MLDADVSEKSTLLVLKKVAKIFDCFSASRPRLTLKELIEGSGLPRTTCQRLVKDLAVLGLLESSEGGYRVGLELVRLAAPGTYGWDLARLLRPALRSLRDGSDEVAVAYVRDRMFRTVISVADKARYQLRAASVGQVRPVLSGAVGAAFLAFDAGAMHDLIANGFALSDVTFLGQNPQESLDSWRELGYVLGPDTDDSSLMSVCAPVWDAQGGMASVIAALTPTSEDVESLIIPVRQAAVSASSLLGFS